MNEIPTITIDMDKKCTKCGEEGALPSGICLACFTKYQLPKVLKKMKNRSNKPNP